MKVLVTGASGFVGRYLCAELAKTHDVSTLSFSKFGYEDLLEADSVIHLAALVHQMKGAPEEAYFRVNSEKTMLLAKRAKELGVKHFIFMSTVKVYGEKTSTSLFNEGSLCEPEDAYGQSKLEAERMLQDMESEDFRVSIVRSPLIYGEDVKANMRNLMKLIYNVPLLPFGGILNKRSIVYVGNLTAMIEEIVMQKKSGTFLASDKEAVSTTQLIQMLADVMEKKIMLISLPSFLRKLFFYLKPGLYERLFGNLEIDNHQTLQTLHFSPPFSTLEGLRRMVKSYQETMNSKGKEESS